MSEKKQKQLIVKTKDTNKEGSLAKILTFPMTGNRCSEKQRRSRFLLPPRCVRTAYFFSLPSQVPTRYGVVLGAVIGGILGVVLLLLLLFYLIRYCWLRRQAALQRRLR